MITEDKECKKTKTKLQYVVAITVSISNTQSYSTFNLGVITTLLVLQLYFNYLAAWAFECSPINLPKRTYGLMTQTDRHPHMERYIASERSLFTTPPSERREIWGAIIGSPHMSSPQCVPCFLHREHFDDNLLHYTLTFRQ